MSRSPAPAPIVMVVAAVASFHHCALWNNCGFPWPRPLVISGYWSWGVGWRGSEGLTLTDSAMQQAARQVSACRIINRDYCERAMWHFIMWPFLTPLNTPITVSLYLPSSLPDPPEAGRTHPLTSHLANTRQGGPHPHKNTPFVIWNSLQCSWDITDNFIIGELYEFSVCTKLLFLFQI